MYDFDDKDLIIFAELGLGLTAFVAAIFIPEIRPEVLGLVEKILISLGSLATGAAAKDSQMISSKFNKKKVDEHGQTRADKEKQ